MAHANDANGQRPCARPWRRRWWWRSARRLSRRLFRCRCLCREAKEPLRGQEKRINGGPRQLGADRWGSGEKEAVQITVEDLGIVNCSFVLSEEDPLTRRTSAARSAGSGSACHTAEKKKHRPLGSLPLQLQAEPATTSTSGEDGEDEEEEAESLLTPPVINLIPPTPSDVVNDRFFNNSEESVARRSGSDGSPAPTERKSDGEKTESEEAEDSTEGRREAGNDAGADGGAEAGGGPGHEGEEDRGDVPLSSYQVAPLPEYPQRKSFNTGINLLSFTELNLDDLSGGDRPCADMVATDVRGLRPAASARASAHRRTPVTHSSLLGETLTRSATFHGLTQATAQRQEEGSPRQRRITVASYMPQPRDQNGNFPEKDADERATKPLRELSTDGLCRWFTSIGLERCLPFIREAKLCGADIASVDANTLDILHVTTLEDREQLLSAIYAELHPPSTTSQRLDSLLETLGPNHVETFAATLVSMSKSRSSPHVSCLSLNRRSLKVRNNSQSCNTQLIEVTVTASERMVHLRTPKETTVGKIMDSCIKMLGATEDKCLFTLREKHSSLEELMPDQQVGGLLTSASDNAQVELLLCKLEKPASPDSPKSPDVDSANENGSSDTTLQPDKEKRIRELKQQVDSLQNVILQVQELHLSLVAFCSELKSMDGDVNADELGADELQRRLELVQSRVSDKKQSLRTLRGHISKSAAHKTKQLEVHLLEKMKLNCQVFKEEISLVHFNRQVAQLQSALDESTAKEKSPAVCSLGQLVSPRRPAMLLVVQEKRRPGGHYGFTCRHREGGGLVVVEVDDSHLCVDDRLVEVNGTLVVNWTQEELTQHLLQGPSAQVVVLRQPPPTGSPQQQPPLPQHMVHPGPAKTACQEQDQVAMATPPRRRLMAI